MLLSRKKDEEVLFRTSPDIAAESMMQALMKQAKAKRNYALESYLGKRRASVDDAEL